MPATATPTCAACGQRLPCANPWCQGPGRPLGSVYAVGPYQGALRGAILSYKFGADLRWARPFADLLMSLLTRHATWFEELSVICPVPSFQVPARGGHIDLICRYVADAAPARAVEWPVERLLAKTEPTDVMGDKPLAERRRLGRHSLGRAFAVTPQANIRGRRVVLVDDVCASGSTLYAAAGALHRAGAAEVVGLVLAQAVWRGAPSSRRAQERH